ncbi:hypothetical protein C5F63_14700 [Photobacterium damselae subsp. damselae]|uniref:dsDNA nuclease domain-containing protein n=1 Tax=Photobacterium damselae TaxID=38293 RepID=UPI000D072C02|nr:dsDNA nuclease domain-containing protein [Photobacterium damselae]PSB85458.1 hypothetical protein C5F63_14700 [Photobacterium damselae subsp. damselae]
MSLTVMDQSDVGGPGALKGFNYQNFAAAYYLLAMLRDKSLVSVRCEVIDDIDLVYDNRIEYVQVKTTDDDTKWSIKEFAEASTKIVPAIPPKRTPQKISNEDSILHKSLACDKTSLDSYFRILTTRDVKKELQFLKVDFPIRATKVGRDKLLRSLQKKLKTFKSSNGNDVEYWLDHAIWTVIPTATELELTSTKMILQAAQEQGIYLNSNGDPERILHSLLINLTKKSAISRVLRSAADKSYHRKDFIRWFNEEIEYYAGLSNKHIKVYSTKKSSLQAILSNFFSESSLYESKGFQGDKVCNGLHGSYHRNAYSYNQIAKNLCPWLPEVLLNANELADHSPEKLEAKVATFTNRKKQHLKFINKLVAKVLLHSTIRTEYKSQPIPANLYVDDSNGTCFDNIHIVLDPHSSDKLLMGFSHLIEGDLNVALNEIVLQFDELLGSEAFDTQKEKILEAKEDNYLLKHDIDDILRSNSSLDEHIERFRFVFFLGYESGCLDCNKKAMPRDYKAILEQEVTNKFSALIDSLINESDYYEDLNIDVYLYPIPSITSLTSAVKTQVKL